MTATTPLISLYIAASLDGYIARPDGALDWLPPIDLTGAGGEDYGYGEYIASVGAIISGSATYEAILDMHRGEPWSYRQPMYVMTERPLATPPEGARVEAVDRDPVSLVDSLRRTVSAERIFLLGGAAVAASFFAHDLVDEIQLFTIPVLLGEGISLWPSNRPELAMRLDCVLQHDGGIVEARYRRDRASA